MKRYVSLILSAAALLTPAVLPATPAGIPVPAPATARIATTALTVTLDRANWTYRLGENATFKVAVMWDGQPLAGVPITYRLGPEKFEAAPVEATVPAEGLIIEGGTMQVPGFLRCIVEAEVEGRRYRALATAGFEPENIAPTQTEPEDFDAFWRDGLNRLGEVPLAPTLTILPDSSTAAVNVYHVSFQTLGSGGRGISRVYGILAEPTAPGPHPAVLRVPGAGVRPYTGQIGLANAGFITLEIGIHGIPVNLPQPLYDELRRSALAGYPGFNLDDRENYYYRRVVLECVRANDFLTSRPGWDGKNLVVFGGSQGGQLAISTAALDPRVKAVAANYPAYSDVTGYLEGRAGGWPHILARPENQTPEKIAVSRYYDTVNFAKRLKVPGFYSWGYNDETCPTTSLYAVYNVITAPKELLLALETGHRTTPEQSDAIDAWLCAQAGLPAP